MMRTRFSAMDPLGSMDEGASSELASDRLRLFGSLAEPFVAAARLAPLIVLLDDVHRADEASQAFLLYLIPRIAGGDTFPDPGFQVVELGARQHVDVPRLEVASRRRLQGRGENALQHVRRHRAVHEAA